MEDEESFFWWSVIMSKQSWPPPPIFLMILTEESRIFPLKQPGLGGGSEMLQSAARGRMEKLVQTCLRDLDWGWGERVERERKNWFITNNRFLYHINVIQKEMVISNWNQEDKRIENTDRDTILREKKKKSVFQWQETL